MLEIVVKTENWERHVRASGRELAGLVRRMGGDGDRFLVAQRIPDLPDVFAQVWHKAGGDYALEHRDGAADRHFQAMTDRPEVVIAALTGWARQEDGWDADLVWSLLDMGPTREVPLLDLDEDELEELEKRVREVLVGGYASRAELAELAEEYLVTEDRRPVSREQAEALADRMWLERVAEQATWQGETDPERLTRAFTALQKAGITARENFTCCRNCGQSEIGGEGGPDARGFVYFHTQCTDSAAAGHGLMLLYGGCDGSSETTEVIGNEVVAALEAAGLNAEWDRDPGQAITVTPLDWCRRLVG
ncbi:MULTISPECIES: DUF6891 domain-containing protein [unclassified Streptomyces]|uniref:DUF6891 domain-containing protein n=1 Tax=unclassified Streptomyces TaxID=2593676 RepID=UPI00225663E6|nr:MULTISPECIES: hypothetical protein [unclassified Streptomyces]MCX4794895.1 hypothetical protein [Streptomyces sp. NBC_01242]WSJ36202.1 hypothetical protein OG772_09230 [Streptomyces sp. NBC_01321]WSP62655.1 hypothetical protein OG466_12705 [Streptomyces sp. NBC_01240]